MVATKIILSESKIKCRIVNYVRTNEPTSLGGAAIAGLNNN